MTEHERQHFLKIYEEHFDMVYRICFSFMKNIADTEDAVSETFLRLIRHMGDMENERHIKGWLVVAASNYCKSQLKHWWRRNKSYEDGLNELAGTVNPPEINETLEAVMGLPDKYKTAVYLHYYEGYNSEEIGEMTGKSASAVRNDLQKARKILKVELKNSHV